MKLKSLTNAKAKRRFKKQLDRQDKEEQESKDLMRKLADDKEAEKQRIIDEANDLRKKEQEAEKAKRQAKKDEINLKANQQKYKVKKDEPPIKPS